MAPTKQTSTFSATTATPAQRWARQKRQQRTLAIIFATTLIVAQALGGYTFLALFDVRLTKADWVASYDHAICDFHHGDGTWRRYRFP